MIADRPRHTYILSNTRRKDWSRPPQMHHNGSVREAGRQYWFLYGCIHVAWPPHSIHLNWDQAHVQAEIKNTFCLPGYMVLPRHRSRAVGFVECLLLLLHLYHQAGIPLNPNDSQEWYWWNVTSTSTDISVLHHPPCKLIRCVTWHVHNRLETFW